MENQNLEVNIEEKVDTGLIVLEDLVENLDTFNDFSLANAGISILNEMKPFYEAVGTMIEGASALVNSLAKVICEVKIPKLEFPVLDEETRNYFKFVEIASTIGFPVFFEVDTELQDKLISLCGDYLEEYYPMEEIKQCIYEYYDHDMLMKMLDTWFEQEWIVAKRKEALKEAVKGYQEGYYFSTGSIMMCQLGGLINDLFETTNFAAVVPLEERRNMNSLYCVGNVDSEKGKVLQMMSQQEYGVLQWYKAADYMMTHTYSSSQKAEPFEHDPGRHKICHGVQINYGTKEHALKSILVVDMIVQLGEQMLHQEELTA